MNAAKRRKAPLTVQELAGLAVADCEATDAYPPGEQRKYAPLITLGRSEVLLRVSEWVRLPFGLEGSSKATDDSFKVRLALPRALGVKLAEFEAHCADRLAKLKGCDGLSWVQSVKEDRGGALAVNVKVVLGGSYEPATQFKARTHEGFASGQGALFYRSEVAARGHFREGHARLVLRPRYYVMLEGGTAGLYFTATHVALWGAQGKAAELDVDAVFPSEELLGDPPQDEG